MNIVKFGGSIVNPDGVYDETVINEFVKLVKSSPQKFLLVVGGGKLSRKIQAVAKPFLHTALNNKNQEAIANDYVGIAVTKINASYVLEQFKKDLGKAVYPEVILDPTQKIKSKARVFIAGGWKPGVSTDTDMMLLAKLFKAKRVFKISNFAKVKKIRPQQFAKLSKQKQKKVFREATDIEQMSWRELKNLVGNKWVPGLSTPFDPEAAKIGLKLKVTLYIGKKEEFIRFIKKGKFEGTIVKN
jgi:uridylate kinase